MCKFDFTMNKVKRDNDKIVCGKTGYLNVTQCVKKVFVVILWFWEVILHLWICGNLLNKVCRVGVSHEAVGKIIREEGVRYKVRRVRNYVV